MCQFIVLYFASILVQHPSNCSISKGLILVVLTLVFLKCVICIKKKKIKSHDILNLHFCLIFLANIGSICSKINVIIKKKSTSNKKSILKKSYLLCRKLFLVSVYNSYFFLAFKRKIKNNFFVCMLVKSGYTMFFL